MSDDDDFHQPWMLDPDVDEEEYEVIEDAEEAQDARKVGDVPGFKDTEDYDLRHQTGVAGAAMVHYTVSGLLVAGALAVGVWGVLEPPPLGQPAPDSETASAVDHASVHASRTRLSWALETYRIDAGEYPDDLSALADWGLLRSRDVYYPLEGKRWRYRPTADGCDLEAESTTR